MKHWSKLCWYVLAALVPMNIIGLAVNRDLRAELRHLQPHPALTVGSLFPRFSGIDIHGVAWTPSSTLCRVIRITDDNCPYCESDKPSYSEVLDHARNADCEIIEFSPIAGGMSHDPRSSVVQLKFVDTNIGRVLSPFAVPQTIILDEKWTVTEMQRGTYDARSLARSLAAIRSLGTHNGRP